MEQVAVTVVKKLREAGHVAYFAGGWVRDYLLGISSSDVDLSTSASPDEVIALFPRTIAVGKAFGVVIVLEGGHAFEVASFRKDGLYIDGRHPTTIEKGTAEEDAKRRDFTINGLFYDPLKGEILDFVGGKDDLKKGVIRAIGEAKERFKEDRLRMIRAIRFAARFGWKIDEETEIALKALSSTLFPAVAKERVWQEWVKMGEYKGLGSALLLLQTSRLLDELLPQFSGRSLETFAKKLNLLPTTLPLPIRWALSFEEPSLRQNLKEMKVSKEELEAFDYTLRSSKTMLELHKDPVQSVLALSHPHADLLLEGIIVLNPHIKSTVANFKSQYEAPIERAKKKKRLITSERLIKEGIEPGKKMGLLLEAGEHEAIRKGLTHEDEVIHYLKTVPLWSNP